MYDSNRKYSWFHRATNIVQTKGPEFSPSWDDLKFPCAKVLITSVDQAHTLIENRSWAKSAAAVYHVNLYLLTLLHEFTRDSYLFIHILIKGYSHLKTCKMFNFSQYPSSFETEKISTKCFLVSDNHLSKSLTVRNDKIHISYFWHTFTCEASNLD